MAPTVHPTRSVAAAAAGVAALVTTEAVESGLDGVDAAVVDGADFSGNPGQALLIPDGSRIRLFVGVGAAGSVDTRELRRAAATVARRSAQLKRVAVELPDDIDLDGATVRQAVAEGVVLGAYRFTEYKSKPTKPALARVDIVGSTAKAAAAAIDTGVTVATAQSLARDFVNEPGGSLTAPEFAKRAAAMARKVGLKVKVWDEAAIKKGKLGGVLGVNRGSDNPPRLVELTYEPKGKATGTLALVGKGITFDAGGLSIKTGAGMMTMKCDMGGAAAVIGAMSALPAIAPKCRVRAFVPMTDNMLGGDATRPGDVLTIRNGKTIEVLNTDAEGRLILADALSLASEEKPDAIIDLATLTGACMVALGPGIAGVMGNDDSWIAQVEAASAATDERVWQLPLPADYRDQVDSPVADMKNIGGPHGGALTAGLILQEFVADGLRWAHLDIAGPAFTDRDDADITKGGTGFGVRLLVELAREFTPG